MESATTVLSFDKWHGTAATGALRWTEQHVVRGTVREVHHTKVEEQALYSQLNPEVNSLEYNREDRLQGRDMAKIEERCLKQKERQGEKEWMKSKQHQNEGSLNQIVKKRSKIKWKILKGRETEREMVRQVIFSLTGQLSDSQLGPTDKTGQVRANTHARTHL